MKSTQLAFSEPVSSLWTPKIVNSLCSPHVAWPSLSGGKALTENLKSNSNKVPDTLAVTALLIMFIEINVTLLWYV